MIPRRYLLSANFIVIGAMVERNQFLEVGGFEEFKIFEDWHCWLKLWKLGAEIEDCDKAIYRITDRKKSRNKDLELYDRTIWDIRTSINSPGKDAKE